METVTHPGVFARVVSVFSGQRSRAHDHREQRQDARLQSKRAHQASTNVEERVYQCSVSTIKKIVFRSAKGLPLETLPGTIALANATVVPIAGCNASPVLQEVDLTIFTHALTTQSLMHSPLTHAFSTPMYTQHLHIHSALTHALTHALTIHYYLHTVLY